MTILYVDDDAEDREIFCEAVNQVDPAIACIVSGVAKKALEIIVDSDIDIVLVDYRMPQMDGQSFIQELSRKAGLQKMPRVYIYSTFLNEFERDQCKRLGATECITKPGNFDDICALIRSLISK